jgi:metallo-beta-lactamase family protein
MKITFQTGVGTVTGANFLLEIGKKPLRVLVDCGLIQGDREDSMHNRDAFGFDPMSIDMLFVTHAHLDHVGRIGKLVKEGFKGVIYSTFETQRLGKLIMDDAVSLLDREARSQGVLPLYEQKDVESAMRLWKTLPYHEETTIEGGTDAGGFSVYLGDAGHILGSTMYRFTYEKQNIVFTGDLGNTPTPLLRDTDSIEGAQYLVMESVYGDRNHEPKTERRAKLEQVIKETIHKGGTLVIPAFSLERTQVLLYELNDLVEHGRIPVLPIFVDSPLAIKVTDIYKASSGLFNEATRAQIARGDDIFSFPRLMFTMTGDESRAIDHSRSPKIILAGSGMSMGGRVTHHEALYLPDPKNTILLVGFQPIGTLGRQIMDGAKEVSINGEKIQVKAQIESILGYSSHKDSDHLVEFVSQAEQTLKKVFVVMGEPKAATFLSQRLNHELGVDAIHPDVNKVYTI